MVLTLHYPAAANNNFKKYYVCYRMQQKLQEIHNTWGAKYNNGEITLAEWNQFKNEWYEPRDNLVIAEILRIRKLAKNYNWSMVLTDFFIEE